MNPAIPMALLAGSPGAGEIIVIFLVVLVLFGPRRLPEIARMIGKTLHELRRASEDFKGQIMSIDAEEVDDCAATPVTDEDGLPEDYGYPETADEADGALSPVGETPADDASGTKCSEAPEGAGETATDEVPIGDVATAKRGDARL